GAVNGHICVREILEKTETSRQSNPVESKAG
ncbi:hypothetical protein OHE73_14385, partial [Escherichia coli]|nr:hypothetical protein [Escherichia coli]